MKSKTIPSLNLSDDYQIEDDLRTLAKANLIRKDPKRLKAALKMAEDHIDALEELDPEESDPGDKAADKASGEKDD